MMIGAPGIAEIAIVAMAVLTGGVGFPVSLPPAEHDALLDKLAPESCLYFTCWSGSSAADGSSGNRTEQLIADPEIQQFLKQAEREFRAAAIKVGGPEGAMVGEAAPAMARMILTNPLCIYVADFTPPSPDGPPTIRAGLAVKTSTEVGAQIKKLLAMLPPDATVESSVAPGFRQLQVDAAAPPVVFGFKNEYFLATIGDKEMEALVKRASTDAPGWVKQLREKHDIDRVATISYANLGAVISKLGPLGGPQGAAVMEQLGLNNLTTFSAVTGLDDSGFVSFANVDAEGELKGILASMNGKPLTAADLATVPRSPYLAVVSKLNAGQIINSGLGIMKSVEPEAAAEFEQRLTSVDGVIGMSFQELVDSLGDTWSMFMTPEDGGFLSGVTLTVSLKDAAKVKQVADRLKQLAAQDSDPEGPSPIGVSTFQGQTIYYANSRRPMPIAPAWAVTDSHLVVGLFPQAIKSFMLHRSDQENLAAAPEVATHFQGDQGPLSVAYIDNKRLVELFYPLTHYGLRIVQGELAREGVIIDIGALPSTGAVTQHLGAGVSVARRTETGFEVEQRQVLPGTSAGATAPVAAALLLPAVARAERTRGVMKSQNNMKQILLAFHNFHDTFRAWPPLYGIDKDAKPTLSWRVYLLPYLEQSQLFDQFHMDEPWDSPHNRKLIAQMPSIYRAPGSKAPPTHTTYLAVQGKGSVLAPQDKSKAGERILSGPTGIRHIVDGTSNTVMVVQANDSRSVIWTKPGDYEYSAENPIQGLIGAVAGAINVGFADGSVRRLPASLPKETWNLLFQKDDGQPVELP